MAAPRIEKEELKRKMDTGEDLTILDSRGGSWHESDRQIPGAIRLPADRISAMFQELPRDKEVVAYCN